MADKDSLVKASSPVSSDDSDSFVDATDEMDDKTQTNGVTAQMENLKVETDFSIVNLEKCFSACLSDPSLNQANYVDGYRELYKFLTMLGSVFTWVAADVKAKIDVLNKYLSSEDKEKYVTIQAMLIYEEEKGMVKRKKNDDPSGSRTLLRLHRALEYIIAFLDACQALSDEDRCSVVSRTAYETTLMKYHPWVVQKAAKLAMGLLPTKKGLIDKIVPSGDPAEIKKAQENLVTAVEVMKKVYDATQVFYKEKNLLDIP